MDITELLSSKTDMIVWKGVRLMISPGILLELVPDRDPEEDYPSDQRLYELERDAPERRIGVWADYLRYQISREVHDNKTLDRLIETSGFVAVGVFRAPDISSERPYERFPIISGYQFGVVLLRGSHYRRTDDDYVRGIGIESGRFDAPLIQTIATFYSHTPKTPDGCVAAIYDEDDEFCGITAAHVVEQYRLGQRVPVLCPDCGEAARLRARAPGFIDAAKVAFPCGGPYISRMINGTQNVRGAIEGETVDIHLGETGRERATVMLSLSTPSQIKCAATPKHFLTDISGHPGDSGSLVSAPMRVDADPDLIGIYLGETTCKNENNSFVRYGYGLDLQQAADILGATDLKGVFNA